MRQLAVNLRTPTQRARDSSGSEGFTFGQGTLFSSLLLRRAVSCRSLPPAQDRLSSCRSSPRTPVPCSRPFTPHSPLRPRRATEQASAPTELSSLSTGTSSQRVALLATQVPLWYASGKTCSRQVDQLKAGPVGIPDHHASHDDPPRRQSPLARYAPIRLGACRNQELLQREAIFRVVSVTGSVHCIELHTVSTYAASTTQTQKSSDWAMFSIIFAPTGAIGPWGAPRWKTRPIV